MGEWGNGRLFLLPFSPSPPHPFAALAFLSADTAPPRRDALHFRSQKPVLRLAPSTLLRPASLSPTPRPTGQANTPVPDLSPWPERRPGPGASGQFLPLPAPARL